MPISSRFTPHVSLLTCLALYFALSLPQLDLPGLHNDEAVEGGLQAGQILDGQPITTFREAGIEIAGRVWPLMVQDYIGAFNVYLPIPFLALFGHTAVALRLYTVTLGAVTIALTFGFARSVLGLRVALITGLLMAVSPSFLFWQRQGVFVTSITSTFAIGMLWAGHAWWRTRQVRWALLTGLLAGMGLYAKLLFVWVIGGAIGASVIVGFIYYWTHHAPRPLKLNWSLLGLSALLLIVGFLLGIAPLVQYNLQTGGTFSSIGTNLTTSYYGVNNLDVVTNFGVRVEHFRAVIAGRDHLWYLGGIFSNPYWDWALGLAVLVIVARSLPSPVGRRVGDEGGGLFLVLLLALGLAQSSFTVSGLFPTHFAIFTPFWPLVFASAFNALTPSQVKTRTGFVPQPLVQSSRSLMDSRLRGSDGLPKSRLSLARLAFILGFAFVWARDITMTLDYHRVLASIGGAGGHTDAVYRLMAELQPRADQPLYALDWGFAPQLRMLTRETLAPLEIFGYSWEPDEGFAARMDEALAQPEALYIFHTPEDSVFPRRDAFNTIVQARGLSVETIAIIRRRDTVPVFEVVRVVP